MKRLFRIIGIILLIIAIIILTIITLGVATELIAASTVFLSLTVTEWFILGMVFLAVGCILAPERAKGILQSVSKRVGNVFSSLAAGLGIPKLLLYIGLGFIAYGLVSSSSEHTHEDSQHPVIDSQSGTVHAARKDVSTPTTDPTLEQLEEQFR